MPDEAEVEAGLAGFIAGALYPDGPGARSAVGVTCRVYRGAPVAEALEAELARGLVHIVVQPVEGSFRDTTRFPTEWQGSAPACPLTAEVDGVRARFSGRAGPGMLAGVEVDGRAYVWRVPEAVTPTVVAGVLADLVQADRPCALEGATLTFEGARAVVARAVSDGVGGEELRRQETRFRVVLWCPSPDVRDRVAAFVDAAVAGQTFLDVRGWGCLVRAAGGRSSDDGAAVRAWRRELTYSIEYPTVRESSLPSMLFGVQGVNGAQSTV